MPRKRSSSRKDTLVARLEAMSSADVDELLRQFGIKPQPTVDAVRKLIREHRRGLHGKEASERVVRFLIDLADYCRVVVEAAVRPFFIGCTAAFLPANA